MSAKPAKKTAAKTPPPPAPLPAAAPALAADPAPATTGPASPPPAWIDSSDPKKRRLGQAVLVGVWLYVAALWLLAVDQYFNLGIFGPKIPPLP